jgi:hypothetical protein
MQEEIKKMFARECSLNHTYTIKIILSNVSPDQMQALNDLLTAIESEGVKCNSWEHEND